MTETPLQRLIRSVPQVGCVEWIGTAAASRAEVVAQSTATLREGTGIDGDHHAAGGKGSRQVTLIQAEHLPVVAALLQVERVEPALLRRNVLVSGINLWGLRKLRFSIGDVLLEGTGPCPPCSRMEEILGAGGYHAMRGHGGICGRVIQGGRIEIGAEVRLHAGED